MEPLNQKSQIAQEYGLLPAAAQQQQGCNKKKHAICQNVSVLLSSDFPLKKLTCLHVHYASMTSEPTQGPLQKRKLSHWPLMWQGHIDIIWPTLAK